MNNFEQNLKASQLKTEWALNKPTMKERRKEKSSLSKITTILEGAANRLESFELEDYVCKRPSLTKVYGYFFPEAVETIEVPQEPSIQQYDTTKEGNVVYANFNR